EAMIGAMYLDQGYEITSQFIEREILKELPRILENQLYRDPKSRFQEMAQDRVGITPIYKVLKEQGPDHAKHFTVGVFLDKELVASGEGVSKQEAQEKAAQAGLKEREWG
ncbi:MAG: Ribonuclease 3, partial [Parcubacteria group bacterium GW2011_GWF2_38_8]